MWDLGRFRWDGAGLEGSSWGAGRWALLCATAHAWSAHSPPWVPGRLHALGPRLGQGHGGGRAFSQLALSSGEKDHEGVVRPPWPEAVLERHLVPNRSWEAEPRALGPRGAAS